MYFRLVRIGQSFCTLVRISQLLLYKVRQDWSVLCRSVGLVSFYKLVWIGQFLHVGPDWSVLQGVSVSSGCLGLVNFCTELRIRQFLQVR